VKVGTIFVLDSPGMRQRERVSLDRWIAADKFNGPARKTEQ